MKKGDDPLAPLEDIKPEGWFAMAEADATLIQVAMESRYVLTDKDRAATAEAAKRIKLFSWWCQAYTQSVLKCASAVLTK